MESNRVDAFHAREESHIERVELLGVGVDAVDMPNALFLMEQFIAEGVPRMVVTADASGIVAAQSDRRFHDVLEKADLVTPDSVGVLWAMKRAGRPLTQRVSGVELVDEVCRLSSRKGYRVFFLGAAPGVAERAADRMRLKHPGANIVGTQDGFFHRDEERAIINRIRELQADVLFVAMGIPKQELFISDNMYELNAKVAMGVGGSFDVLSGLVKRAPVIVQKLKMEWAWRFIMNPRKWSKIAQLPKFWWMVIRTPKRAI